MKTLFIKFILFFLISTNSFASTKRVFNADKDAVWRALLISLSNYPLEKNDYENGEILTSLIPEGQQWRPLHKDVSPRNTYSMSFQVFEDRQNRTVITAKKTLTREGDFLEASKEIQTQGVELSVILYRVQRELVVDMYVKSTFKN